ncbi:unnamed protein product [Bursaphelenchus okinawaensis]|uniref:C3H1-type domain-containing protein n=1 Tax=Bursaphelenchus okinawaensis TaxID=465554 RepID=A0A811KE78_9BILA|nr:unnamed protein product [Bursaphelenchus okinawaensis]CAG9101589.1 unnamed protein product [Bursaphelenchus okinawaensis]
MFTVEQQQQQMFATVAMPCPSAPTYLQASFAAQQQLANFLAYQQAINAHMLATMQQPAYGMPPLVAPQLMHPSQAHWGQAAVPDCYTTQWSLQVTQNEVLQCEQPQIAPPSVLWTPTPSPDNEFKNFSKPKKLISQPKLRAAPAKRRNEKKIELDDEAMDHVVDLMDRLLDDGETPAKVSGSAEKFTYREQKNHLFFDRHHKTMKSTTRKMEIPLLNGTTFNTMPKAAIWPMYAVMPVESDAQDLNEKINKKAIKMERYFRNYKTTMCNKVQKGEKCLHEGTCCFAHNEEEIRDAVENVSWSMKSKNRKL